MFDDVLSQEQEENLFDDEAGSEDMPVEESAEEAETTEQPEEPFLKIQYDKQEYGLSRQEAKDLAEKGKNYDRMRDKYNNLYDRLDRLAKLNDLDVEDYISRLDSTQVDYMVNKEFKSLKEAHPNDSDELLQEIAQRRVEANMDLRAKKQEDQMKSAMQADEERARNEVERFMNEYPEFRDKGPDSLDPKVFEYVDQGYSLLEAYNKFLRSPQIVEKQKAEKQNQENKKRSLGNTTNAGKVETDDFLSGFLNG